MKLKYLLIIGGTICLPLSVHAVDIKVLTAGGLATAAESVNKEETALTLSGTMNAADFSYILDNFNHLQTLDLSGVKIADYAGANLPYTGMSHSPAATLPPYSLTGLATLKSVKLPAELTAIGKGAFSGTGITSIDIPSGVQEIGAYAFMRCNSLETANVPASVKSIGERAFAYCDKLITVNVVEKSDLTELSEGLFEASAISRLDLKNLTDCIEIEPWALAECNKLETITLPASMEHIGDYAMAGNKALKEIHAEDIAAIPMLGENVWHNVNQSAVRLIVPDKMVDDFNAQLQWKEFDIIGANDNVNAIRSEVTEPGLPLLSVSRQGDVIIAEADNPLHQINVYNVAGFCIARKYTDKSTAEFNISGWSTGVYLIVCEAGVAKISI